MFIEELIIDGFKSYAARTHITGWDPEFNAITGLNGSGKSNILDAICFVLGISNLSHVRASNLQDLVYKKGQAGISKASVTIVFNNHDSTKSPVGYEQYKQITVTRQILIGGRNKYLINGHNAQQQALSNLFQSVQLNIHNPHFLIMQGKITKVLNMKPPEILAMIEEAAGTRMFEERKEKALKTIGKKEKKLEEIQTILDEEITPKLDRLREEKRSYLEYQKVEVELEFNKRLLAAYQYTKNEAKLKESGADFDQKKRKIEENEQELQGLSQELNKVEQEIKRLHDAKTKNSETLQLEGEVKALANQLVRINTQLELKQKTIDEERKSLNSAEKQRDQLSTNLEQARVKNQKTQKTFEKLKHEFEHEKSQLERDEQLLQTLTTGISAKEGSANGYLQQIQASKRELAKLSTDIEKSHLKIDHLGKSLQKMIKEQTSAKAEHGKLLSKKDLATQDLKGMQENIDSLDFDSAKAASLRDQMAQLTHQIQNLSEQESRLLSQTSQLQFNYTDPSHNFNRKKVKGLVAELFSLENSKFATALEICAGGRLYNVVVEDANTGASLLKNGRLRSRVTIIPLNKISAFRLSAETIATAKRIAPGQVDLALSLVGYQDEVAEAMAYVFGGTFICDDPNTAKEISSKRKLGKCVTLEGDVYDPSGTLQGGSKPNSSGIIIKANQIKKLRSEIEQLNQQGNAAHQELSQLSEMQKQYDSLKQIIDLKKHEIKLMDQQLLASTHSQLSTDIENTKKEIVATEQQQIQAEKDHEQTKIRIEHLQSEMHEFENDKGSKITEIQNKVKKSKGLVQAKTQFFKEQQRQAQVLQMELEAMESELKGSNEQIENIVSSIEASQAEQSEIKNQIGTTQDKLDVKEALYQKQVRKLRDQDHELKELEALRQSQQGQISALKLATQQLNHTIERFEAEVAKARHVMAQLVKEHSWINDLKSQFGKPGSGFDFDKVNLGEASSKLGALEKQHEALRKKINLKVMSLIDSVEKKEANLKSMLNTVKKDKKTIESTISMLDDFKLEALQKTWEKVDVDFGSIFSELLPGNSAKLVIPDGMGLMDGLQVKVNLGGIWKQSLTELSGGQRSLIALSLILSLLQFKPAPFYILDEIDAALDLSHTQNIGNLLRTRFNSSQFVIVSLKDGMFNNANVLFKTKFRDGVSMVERISSSSRRH